MTDPQSENTIQIRSKEDIDKDYSREAAFLGDLEFKSYNISHEIMNIKNRMNKLVKEAQALQKVDL